MLIYPALQAPVLTTEQIPETVTESRWHQPLSEPVRFRINPWLAVVLAVTSGNVFDPFPLPNTNPQGDKYDFSFQQPVRTLPRLRESLQQALAYVGADPFPEQSTESRWHQPYSEPVRFKPAVRTGTQQFFDTTWMDVVSLDRWLLPLAEPVRVKPALKAALQQDLALVKAAPFPESVTFDRWNVPFSEPVRVPPRLRPALNQDLALVKADPFPESITFDRWNFPFTEPVRFQPALRTAMQPTTVWGNAGPYPEAVTIDRFLLALANPVQLQARFGTHLRTNLQPTTVWGQAAPFTEVVTESRWHQPFSEPVRFKPAVRAALQPVMPAHVIVPLFASPGLTLKNTIVRILTLKRTGAVDLQVDFPPMEQNEQMPLAINLVNDLVEGDTLASGGTWTCTVATDSPGTDPSPSSRLIGTAWAQNGTTSVQLVAGILPNVKYAMTLQVNTSLGYTFRAFGHVMGVAVS